MTPDPVRYSRHYLLPGFGPEGQARLQSSHVAIVGLGGLGCPAALYLAAAGVGRITLVDPDVVSLANLQRQILYSTADIGQSKVARAAEHLRAQNPDVEIRTVPQRLMAANIREILTGVDVLIDGSDNFPTRFLTSDAAIKLGIPVVFGALERYMGQVTVFHPTQGGPCYRCLFPELPPQGLIPTCDEAGVLGVLPGLVGTTQATEAIKLITGLGTPLLGRMLVLQVLDMNHRTIPIHRDPHCAACGADAPPWDLRDSTWVCASSTPGASVEETDWSQYLQSTPESNKQTTNDRLLIDVRQPHETAGGVVPNAHLIPLDQWEARLPELVTLAQSRSVYIYCQRGARSLKAAHLLAPALGRPVASLRGGYETYLALAGRVEVRGGRAAG